MAIDASKPASFPGLDTALGFVFDVVSPDRVTGSLTVTADHRQPAGVVHGGVYAAFAESAASAGTYAGVLGDGKTALGISNTTSFLRPVTDGRIHVAASPRHQGRTTWVWDVEMTDDSGRTCALSRVTVAVR